MARDVVWLLSDGCRRSSYGAGSYAAEAVVGCRVSEAPCNDINLDGPHGSDTSSLEPAGDPGTEIQKFDPELVDSSAARFAGTAGKIADDKACFILQHLLHYGSSARAGPFTWLAPSWMDLAKGSETSSVGYMDWKTYPLKTGAEPAAVAAPVEAVAFCSWVCSAAHDSAECMPFPSHSQELPMKFGQISCALLLAYTIVNVLRYRNVDLSQMELGRTLLGNNATHHPILVPMIVIHDVVSVVMTLLLVHQFVRSPFQNKEAHKSVGLVCFADIFPLEVLSGFIVMFCRIWTQPSSKGHQDLNMEEYVILMPWFGLFNVFAVLNAMLCIKPSWRKYTSLMIVVHVLGLLYGFGVMARHLVGIIMALEAYSARGSWKQMDYVRAHQINMQLLTAVAVVGTWITVFTHLRSLWELTLITKMSVQLGGSFAFLYATGFVDVWTTQMGKACCDIASCFAREDKISETFASAGDLSPQTKVSLSSLSRPAGAFRSRLCSAAHDSAECMPFPLQRRGVAEKVNRIAVAVSLLSRTRLIVADLLDAICFNAALAACRQEMPSERIRPNAISCNTSIAACVGGGAALDALARAAEWQRALAAWWPFFGSWVLWLALPGLRAIPDQVARNSLLAAFTEAAQWRYGLALLETGEDLDSYGRSAAAGCFAAAALWREAMAIALQGVGGPVQVLNAALTGCARAAKWQLCLQLVQSAMSACGTPDVATFGIAISALERGRVFWGRALSLLAESQRGSLNRTSVYNTTISAVGAASRWRMSLHLLQSMRDHAQEPDTSSFNASLSACERAWQWEQCLQVLWDAGFSADAASYSIVAGSLEQAGLWQEAIQLLRGVPDLPLPAWRVLVRASAAQGWQHSLSYLLNLLSLSLPGEFLDLALVDSVLGACARSLAWRQALKALDLPGSPWDASCLLQALHACESLHKGPQCEVLRQALGAALSRSALRSPSRKANDRSERGIFATSLHGLVVLASWVRARTCGQPSAGPSTSMALERKVLQEQDTGGSELGGLGSGQMRSLLQQHVFTAEASKVPGKATLQSRSRFVAGRSRVVVAVVIEV
ncbi:Pentatricopeptide repeat-containing protein [Symbiodinium microadriaticum]|uniref:Pentatricopeptide repeat-containing protein n=1 Tax=Symbiodinium microadriaticum TaxID=2951 RepID=A0A1Q9CJX5_SYMMI|nr:Pentatricopeptide repeat-containing protein [Symbiodinium microadriaticum]